MLCTRFTGELELIYHYFGLKLLLVGLAVLGEGGSVARLAAGLGLVGIHAHSQQHPGLQGVPGSGPWSRSPLPCLGDETLH